MATPILPLAVERTMSATASKGSCSSAITDRSPPRWPERSPGPSLLPRTSRASSTARLRSSSGWPTRIPPPGRQKDPINTFPSRSCWAHPRRSHGKRPPPLSPPPLRLCSLLPTHPPTRSLSLCPSRLLCLCQRSSPGRGCPTSGGKGLSGLPAHLCVPSADRSQKRYCRGPALPAPNRDAPAGGDFPAYPPQGRVPHRLLCPLLRRTGNRCPLFAGKEKLSQRQSGAAFYQGGVSPDDRGHPSRHGLAGSSTRGRRKENRDLWPEPRRSGERHCGRSGQPRRLCRVFVRRGEYPKNPHDLTGKRYCALSPKNDGC